MTHITLVKPEWLEIISCCSPKIQMDLIRAIVAWQADGTMPDFRGVKKALFLMLVHDLAKENVAPVAETDSPTEEAEDAEDADDPEQTPPAPEQAPETTADADAPMETAPAPTTPPTANTTGLRRHGGKSSFYPYHRLY